MVQSRAGEGGTVGLVVRMPEHIHAKIKEAAQLAGRSMNSEIVSTLTEAYGPSGDTLPPELKAAIANGESPVSVWRNFRKMTVSDLASASGIDRSTVLRIEQGMRVGSLARMKALADALGVTVDDLV